MEERVSSKGTWRARRVTKPAEDAAMPASAHTPHCTATQGCPCGHDTAVKKALHI